MPLGRGNKVLQDYSNGDHRYSQHCETERHSNRVELKRRGDFAWVYRIRVLTQPQMNAGCQESTIDERNDLAVIRTRLEC